MFKKSVLEVSTQNDPPVIGRLIFNGYAEVRTTPQSPPPLLRARIREGKDVIAIWFQHFHAERFKAWDEWDGVKLSSKEARRLNLLPSINEMTPQEILEFCKSIDVHPAHLVPFDEDKALSLPTPLLELLIDMGYHAKKLNENDMYLARAAVAYECKRIRQDLENDKRVAFKNGEQFSTLAQVFTDILRDPKATQDIAKTTIVTPSKRFASAAAQSYPFIDRVHDIAVIQAEQALEQSNHGMRIKREIFNHRIDGFKKTYHQLFHTNEIEAVNFLEDVIDAFEAGGPLQRPPSLIEVAAVVSELLEYHWPSQRDYDAANDVYIEFFGRPKQDLSEEEDGFLREMEHTQFGGLVASIHQVFDGEWNLIKAQKKHEEREGQYILQVGKIRAAFDGIGDGYQRNLLNNRVLLTLKNIDVREYTAPQTSPK